MNKDEQTELRIEEPDDDSLERAYSSKDLITPKPDSTMHHNNSRKSLHNDSQGQNEYMPSVSGSINLQNSSKKLHAGEHIRSLKEIVILQQQRQQ